MKNWILVCKDQKDAGGSMTARQVWQQNKVARLWGVGESAHNRSKIQKGDRAVIYLAGPKEMVFVGSCSIKSAARSTDVLIRESKIKTAKRKANLSPYYLELNNVVSFKNEIPAILMVPRLEIFQGRSPSKWGVTFQGAIRSISETDFDSILREGRGDKSSTSAVMDGELELAFREGKRSLVSHYIIERSRELRAAKIAEISKGKSTFDCEACGMNFREAYGDVIGDYCEVHHKIPLNSLGGETKLSTKDLSILCANCHRAIHRTGKNSIWTVQRLREHLVSLRKKDDSI
jgi:predicted HNH restriction endonuclease